MHEDGRCGISVCGSGRLTPAHIAQTRPILEDELLADPGKSNMFMPSTSSRSGLSAQSARWRLISWLGAAVYLAVFAGVTAFVDNQDTRATIFAAIFPLAAAAALLASLLAIRSAAGKRFRLWRLLATSASLFLVGLSYRSYIVITEGRFPQAGTFEDAAYVLGLVVLVPVVLLVTEPFEVVWLRKLRAILDLTSLLIALLSASLLYSFLSPGSTGINVSTSSTLLLALYPVMTFSLALYLVVFKRTAWRSSDILILTALVAGAVGITLAARSIDLYVPGSSLAALADLLLSGALLAIALAGIHAYTQHERVSTRPSPEADLPQWPGMVSLAIALAGVPVLVMASTRITDPTARTVLSAAVSLFVVIVVARSAVVTYENRRLARQSIWDPLTGLFNNRYFRSRVAEEVAEARIQDTDVSVCVINIDAFDAFNSEYGYRAGDQRLQEVARLLNESRVGGLAFRIGGDDFALLLPGRGVMEARDVSTRIAMRAGALGGPSLPGVTLSIGIAVMPAHAETADALIRYASGSQYWASSLGGNRVVLFDPNVVDALDPKEHLSVLEQESHMRLVESLAAAVDARDPATRYHSANVARLAQSLCETLGLSDERTRLVHTAAQLHDVGKIGIPDVILRKPSALSGSERETIEEHPTLGAQILQASMRTEMLGWIEAHHERWDGTGYPHGLSGNEIPFEARILSVCDAYDAMTSDRPYRRAMGVSEAVDELKRCAGNQFDPELAKSFVDSLAASWPATNGVGSGDLSP